MEFEALKKVAAAVLGMDPDEIEMDMTFLTDLGGDGSSDTDRRSGKNNNSARGCRIDQKNKKPFVGLSLCTVKAVLSLCGCVY